MMVVGLNNKRGMTLVELLLSIVLISLVLIFIIQLCLRARNAYLNNSVNVKYELSKSIITDAIMNDLIKKDLNSINYNSNNITFNYKDNITKTLTVVSNSNKFLIKYLENSNTLIAREYLASEINFEGIFENKKENSNNLLYNYTIKLVGNDGYDYSIDIYWVVNK